MEKIKVSLKFRGKVILDTTKSNQITEDFKAYVYEALQGLRPLISSYQIYEGITGSTQQAKISQTQQGINEFSVTFTANFGNLNIPIVELYLQAVLTDGTVVTIARVTQNFNNAVQSLNVTWVLVTEFNTYTAPGYPVDLTALYQLIFNFFVNPSSLTVSPPQLDVSYTPTDIPEYQGTDELSFFVAFDNYAGGGLCPEVQYDVTYYLLGSQVLSLTGYFTCTPNPSVLNYIYFDITIP